MLPNRPFSRRLARLAGGAIAIVIAAACTSAAPSGSTAPPTSPRSSPSAAPSLAPTPSAIPPTPTPTTVPSSTPTPLPEVGAAPSGPWTRVDWIAAGPAVPLGPHEVTVHGWSGGYVALEQNGGSDENGNEIPVVIRSSSSRDGVRWTPSSPVDTAGLVGQIQIRTIVEGPSALLALGYPFGDTCGGPEPVVALWTSTDGRRWSRVALPKEFTSGQVLDIAGGPAGFIAIGSQADSTFQKIWTSQDGRAWASRPLPKVSSGTLVLDGATSFAGGFVLAGSVLGEGGCGGPAHIHAATWWSADGAAWTRASLPGALTATNAVLSVEALSDRVVLVNQVAGDDSDRLAWTSTDGRTWTAVHSPSGQLGLDPVSDGRHAALVTDVDSGAPSIEMIGEDARVTTLDQGGDGPNATGEGPGRTYALGPTGIVVLQSDGGAVWLGVPR